MLTNPASNLTSHMCVFINHGGFQEYTLAWITVRPHHLSWVLYSSQQTIPIDPNSCELGAKQTYDDSYMPYELVYMKISKQPSVLSI